MTIFFINACPITAMEALLIPLLCATCYTWLHTPASASECFFPETEEGDNIIYLETWYVSIQTIAFNSILLTSIAAAKLPHGNLVWW